MIDELGSARRQFLGQLGSLAAATALPSSAIAIMPSDGNAASAPWDTSWVKKVTAVRYRCVVDCTNVNDGAALAEFRAGLVPGPLPTPDGVFALVRAQNAGCALLKF